MRPIRELAAFCLLVVVLGACDGAERLTSDGPPDPRDQKRVNGDITPMCDFAATLPEGSRLVQLGTEPQQLTLDNGGVVYRLADGCTDITMRRVHQTVALAGAAADDGLPYLRVGAESWAELITKVTLFREGYRFEVRNKGCDTEERVDEDAPYRAVDSCTIEVETSRLAPEALVPAAGSQEVALDDRYATAAKASIGEQFVVVRSLGFVVGNVDRQASPVEVQQIEAGLDLITPFGVANLEITGADAPIIGLTRELIVGPQRIGLTVLDVGNINTHCHTGSCRNVFDLALAVDVLDARPRLPLILSYL
jgi:hypothetical protein